MKTESSDRKETRSPDRIGVQGSSESFSLEREKIQIERERLALERERWAAEREKFNSTRALADRATGRMTIGISTFALVILCAALVGGGIGAWMTIQNQPKPTAMTASLLQALGNTNNLDGIEGGPFVHRLGGQRRGGYLLILD